MQDLAIAIFGAAVRADGRPSPALARRIGYGVEAARVRPDAPVFCSGAAGEVGPTEASVMATMLAEAGVSADRIVLDEESRDTFESVLAVGRFAKARGIGKIVVCSDRYHLPRIRLMLHTLGVSTIAGPLLEGRGGTPLRYWTYMRAREVLATPYDVALVMGHRLRRLRVRRGGRG